MLTTTPTHQLTAPALPVPRGPLSTAVLDTLRGSATASATQIKSCILERADPYGEDLQLALYCCYELHYRGFAGVADDLEWDPGLLAIRRQLEQSFLAALRSEVPGGTDVTAEVDALLVEVIDAGGVSHHLRRTGQLWQLREYVAHRSLYHLKEADPQAWVIPRLSGPAKAALVTIEHDEYGSGHPHRIHARLFAAMMTELGYALSTAPTSTPPRPPPWRR
jgi:hypothetical protein